MLRMLAKLIAISDGNHSIVLRPGFGEKIFQTFKLLEVKNESLKLLPVKLQSMSAQQTFVNDLHIPYKLSIILNAGDIISDANVAMYRVETCEERNIENFFTSDELGAGSFGVVVAVFEKKLESSGVTSEPTAMKIIKKDHNDFQLTDEDRREVELMKSFKHPHVMKLMSHFETNRELYLQMTFCSGGSLQDLYERDGRFSEDLAKFFIYQIADALKYIHHSNIMHRDIKPENILLKNKRPWPIAILSDFGLSKVILGKVKRHTSGVGAEAFMAPEVLTGMYTKSIDVFSLGATFFFLLFGIFVNLITFSPAASDKIFEFAALDWHTEEEEIFEGNIKGG